MEPEEKSPDDQRRWKMDRSIPITWLVALLVQTAGVVWSAAILTAKVDQLTEFVREFRQDRYTKADAVRDRELYGQQFLHMQQRDSDLERRLQALESRR